MTGSKRMAQAILTARLRGTLETLTSNFARRKEVMERTERILYRRAYMAARIVQIAIRANAPVDTGVLRESIEIRTSSREGFIGYTVRVPKEAFGPDERDYYPVYLEYGWRRKPEGVPFFWSSVDSVSDYVKAVLGQAGKELRQSLTRGRIGHG